MPRPRKPVKYIIPKPHDPEAGKVRYVTKKMAENAAEVRMLQVPGLELAVYQAENGGWYLTSRTDEE